MKNSTDNQDINIFQKNMYLIRKKWEMTELQFGRLIGLSRGAVSAMSRGASEPTIKTLFQLAALVGVLVDDLYTHPLPPARIPPAPLSVAVVDPVPLIVEEYARDYGGTLRCDFDRLAAMVYALEKRVSALEKTVP